ncbi:MAG: hypothetical protein WB764_04880 [Xanthobacteraceae bacterium]
MQDKKVGYGAALNCIGTTVIAAEFHQRRILTGHLNNRTDLTACKPGRRQIRQQRYHIEYREL